MEVSLRQSLNRYRAKLLKVDPATSRGSLTVGPWTRIGSLNSALAPMFIAGLFLLAVTSILSQSLATGWSRSAAALNLAARPSLAGLSDWPKGVGIETTAFMRRPGRSLCLERAFEAFIQPEAGHSWRSRRAPIWISISLTVRMTLAIATSSP